MRAGSVTLPSLLRNLSYSAKRSASDRVEPVFRLQKYVLATRNACAKKPERWPASAILGDSACAQSLVSSESRGQIGAHENVCGLLGSWMGCGVVARPRDFIGKSSRFARFRIAPDHVRGPKGRQSRLAGS